MDSPNNPFYNAIAQLPTNKELLPVHKPPKPPTRSIQVLQDVQPKKLPDLMKDSAVYLSPVEGSQQPASRIGDSDIWSASSNLGSQQSQQPEVASQPVSEEFNSAPPGPDAYRTAPETSSDLPQQLPVQTKNTVLPSSPAPPSPKPRSLRLLRDKPEESKTPETVEQPEVIPFSSTGELKAPERSGQSAASPKKVAPEPRRSGRLAERSPPPSSIRLLSERANDFVPPSSPPVLSRQEVSAVDEEDALTLPTAKSLSPSVLTRSMRPETPTRSAESAGPPMKSPAQTAQNSPSKSSSEPPTPDVPVVRKSILNFAALPAREPLTSKKSLGTKSTHDSHVEQVRLNGASRASWMNKKGSGKSLGASSRQIERIEKQDEDTGQEARVMKPEASFNRKRKSESIHDDSQKRPKASTSGRNQNVDEPEDMEEGSSGETSEAMALHNKAYTQRLQDKIQRLGKSREARSFPPSVIHVAGPSYPELPQADQQTQPIPKRTKSAPQGQLPHTTNPAARWTSQPDDEEEWIPMNQGTKRQLTGSSPDGTTEPKQKEIGTTGPQSAQRWNNPPKQTLVPASITTHSTITNETAPTFSLKSPTYPPKRHLPGSPLKSSFSDDWIKAPASPTRPPGEGAISAVKAHTTSVFKKAKQMLLNSSVSSVSAKIETMTPGLRSWHGGNNLRQQMVIDSGSSRSPEPLKQHDQQLYPDLESIVDTKVPTPASANTPALSKAPTVAAEHIAEPVRESKSRSSKSRDTGDLTPGMESAPHVPKKSKAAERAEREISRAILREREEKLREAEEVLRIAKEEQQRDREEQLQAKEQQRRQKEEQREEKMRKEKEESRKHQEERLKQEKEELRRRQQEELRRQEEDSRKANENPFDLQDEDDDISDGDEESATGSTRGRITSSAEPERPPSRLQKGGPRFRGTGDKNKPFRPGTSDNNLPKPKPGPVFISVGTASQREMQSQRSKPNILTPSTLVAALKQSFEPPGLQASSSQISLSSSVSANSLRVSNPTGSKQLKSLAAAANQLKKVCIISYSRLV